MADNLSALFNKAAASIHGTFVKVSTLEKLHLYALYKQAVEGPCNTPRPAFYDMIGKAKWDSWNSLGVMEKEEAMKLYINEVDALCPGWRETTITKVLSGEESDSDSFDFADSDESEDEGQHLASSRGAGAGAGSSFMTGAVSSFAREEEVISDNEKDVFDWVMEGNVDKVKTCIERGDDLDEVDEQLCPENVIFTADRQHYNVHCMQDMTVLHWACDRGNVEIVRLLLHNKINLNAVDKSGQTVLHYASSCSHKEVVEMLLKAGIKTDIMDSEGATALDVAGTAEIRDMLSKI